MNPGSIKCLLNFLHAVFKMFIYIFDSLDTMSDTMSHTNLTRHYAHAVYGKRAMDATPINTPAGTTVLSSIRLNGSLVYTTYQGGTTAQRFREYMGKQLIPSLEKDDVVIMDNMRSHHAKIVTELLDKAGISYLYLPPYSPDLNPIEKMWSKMNPFSERGKSVLLLNYLRLQKRP